jgi:hypothetical protein
MAAPVSVTAATDLVIVSPLDSLGGRASLASKGLTKGGFWTGLVVRLSAAFATIASSSGNSGGIVLAQRAEVRDFVGFGSTPVATLSAWNALANDATRDDAVILTDADAPIGSTYRGLTCAAGVVTGAKWWMKSAAATWTALY